MGLHGVLRMAVAGEFVVDVRDLRMRYGRTDVLDGVTFAARRGEVLALLGPNGAGKTTTIEILEGFRMRSAGQVSVLGIDPGHGGEDWRARIGVVQQSWRDHAKWRVRELLAHLGRYYAPYSTAELPRPWNADELLATVGLTELAGQKIRRLSGGQRRRLDVAIGIVGRPELLFLDEPTAGFDPQARRDFVAVSGVIVIGVVATFIPGSFLFHGRVVGSATAWLTLIWVLALGLVATLPMGAVLGQVFPLYWLGLGMRSALLPASLASVEIGHSWRHLATFGVLGAWAVVGLLVAPVLLRRMARHESGSAVAARRERAMLRVQ